MLKSVQSCVNHNWDCSAHNIPTAATRSAMVGMDCVDAETCDSHGKLNCCEHRDWKGVRTPFARLDSEFNSDCTTDQSV